MMINQKSPVLGGGLALLMLPALAATAHAVTSEAGAPSTQSSMSPPSVLTFDQKPDGQSVLLRYAYLPKNGYVVIYGSGADGKPGDDPLGNIALNAGDHRDIKVKLDAAPAAKSQLWTALYEDSDVDAKFDKAKDKPLWPVGQLSHGGRFTIQ